MCIRDRASDDVIQRISKIKGIKTVGAMAGGDSTMNLMGGGNDSVSMYIPVSYTHLDVYKRQGCKGCSSQCEKSTKS